MRLAMCFIGFMIASTGSLAWSKTVEVADVKKDQSEKAYVGIHLGPVEEAAAEDEGAAGIRVLQVLEGSPAESAGLLKDDIVTRVGQRSVDNVEHFVYLMSTHAPGDKVNFTIVRDGETQQVEIELGNWPAEGLAPPPPMQRGQGRFHQVPFGAGPDVLGRHLGEIIGDAAGKNVDVDVDCENGEGTIRIEIDGEVQEHSFPCGPGMHKRMWKMYATPGSDDSALDLDLDLDIPGVTQGGFKLFRGFGSEPRTTFEVNDDGSITVRVRKGDSQLVKRYDNAEALPENLRESFNELHNGLE